jgi:hypothetical protein
MEVTDSLRMRFKTLFLIGIHLFTLVDSIFVYRYKWSRKT